MNLYDLYKSMNQEAHVLFYIKKKKREREREGERGKNKREKASEREGGEGDKTEK